MQVTFEKEDIMKALNIYLILKGYESDGYFDFRWKNTLRIETEIKPLKGEMSFENLKKYANR